MQRKRIAHTLRLSAAAMALLTFPAAADDTAPPEDRAWHAQSTVVFQYHPPFHAAYSGLNSLNPHSDDAATVDATIYAGAAPWRGAELWLNGEVDQGYGLSDTVGAAGYVNGEGSKVGSSVPYPRITRLFLRQTVDLGGDVQNVAPDANQLASARTADNLILTLGKFSVTDIFDNNDYAHDPKHDFLNWSVIDGGAYDYAADAWGYSYGGAAEWTQGWWTLRFGVFDMSRLPNGKQLVRGFGEFEAVSEWEADYSLGSQPGKLRLLGYINRARMGSYDAGVALGQATNSVPDTSLVRRYASRPGGEINLQQQISDTLALFARLSMNDGSEEAYEYTEINRSLEVGASVKGGAWGRPNDTVGIAGAVNALSNQAKRYFAAGGMGILIGDGALKYGSEDIVESYYSTPLTSWFTVSFDYQFIDHPAYNRARGPVHVFGIRLHAQI